MEKESKRLIRIASYVRSDTLVLDIGTDHGIIPLYLYEQNPNRKIIATDISSKSLSKLDLKIKEKSYPIRTFVTDGLRGLGNIGAEDIIISGMGGDLIVKILSEDLEIAKKARLILSPQSAINKLRKFLIKNGFEIFIEDLLEESGHYYTIISAEYTGKKQVYSALEYKYGKLENHINKSCLLNMLSEEMKKNEIICKNLGNSPRQSARKKILELENMEMRDLRSCILEN